MSGGNILLDTNIIIYLLQEPETNIVSALQHYDRLYVSFISEMEVLGWPGLTGRQIEDIHSFLEICTTIDIDTPIKKIGIETRRKYKLKLPDSIITATAIHLDCPLFTSDNDFMIVDELTVHFYEASNK